jgi:hypothetical protein
LQGNNRGAGATSCRSMSVVVLPAWNKMPHLSIPPILWINEGCVNRKCQFWEIK